MIVHRKQSFFLLSLFILIISHKNIFNEDADAAGSFQGSTAAYAVAATTILFIGVLILTNLRKQVTLAAPLAVALVFYGSALLLSPVSALPVVSAFRSVSGIGYILASAFLARSLARRPPEFTSHTLYSTIATATLAFAVGSLMFNINYGHSGSIWTLRAGSGALFCLYLSLWHFISYLCRKRANDALMAILIFCSAALLNSFSAYLSIFAAVVAIALLSKRLILSALLLCAAVGFVVMFYMYIQANIDAEIFNKPARSYLIGSGRFPMYQVAFATFLDLPLGTQLIGVGFMAEREILVGSQLTWITDVHNSFLSNLLGLGYFGLAVSLIYAATPFFMFRKFQRHFGAEIALKWIGMHIIFLTYGLTSTSYFSQPSFQLLFFLLFTAVLSQQQIRRSNIQNFAR